MRTALAVIVPWLVWGILDNGIYQILLAVSPNAFNDQSIPNTTVMLVVFLVLRASYSIDAGLIGALIAKGSQKAIPYLAGLLVLTGVMVQALTWSSYPAWYHVGFLVPIVPCALLGVKLGRMIKPAARPKPSR